MSHVFVSQIFVTYANFLSLRSLFANYCRFFSIAAAQYVATGTLSDPSTLSSLTLRVIQVEFLVILFRVPFRLRFASNS